MATPTIDEELIRKLATLIDETGLGEIEYEVEGLRIRLACPPAPTVAAAAPIPLTPAPAGPAAATAKGKETDANDMANAVTSPMVGTAYCAPEPNVPPFVKEGDRVQDGQQVLIVEAMKVMNPILTPRDGIVTRILVKDGQPVEFGQPLIIIE